jgi:hypothetical protein
MKTDSNYIELSNDDLQAQRSVRKVVKRDAVILFIVLNIGFAIYCALIPFLAKYVPLYLSISILLVYFLLFILISNWRGWIALRTFNIQCPHCRQPLFEDNINIFKSPSKKCPHCGQVALAPKKQLK